MQQELIDEIDSVLIGLQGEVITNEALDSMKFLDAVIHETLRKWPPIPFGSRVCSKDCTILTNDGDSLKFVKGDLIDIPFKMIQNDANYFPKPEEFDPSRFFNVISKDRLLAFGCGPRSCVGSHFVLLQSKIYIFTFFRKFSVKIIEKNLFDADNINIFLELFSRKETMPFK